MHTREEEIQMMGSPNRWPQWPILPVKRSGAYNRDRQIGIIFEHEETAWDKPIVRPTVYLTNMFMFDYNKRDEYEKIEYKTLEEMVDDGWVVD